MVIALVVLVAGLFVAHLTRFGRTVYAMGGNNGANEQSARLMGLPVDRTKMQVYMVNGFCSALAGLAYSIYVGSGHGSHATGLRADGHRRRGHRRYCLTGGEGYVLGAFFGVLITALIQSLIQFNGQLSSWWTSIVIGLLMLLFIGVQSVLATLNTRSSREPARRRGRSARPAAPSRPPARPGGAIGAAPSSAVLPSSVRSARPSAGSAAGNGRSDRAGGLPARSRSARTRRPQLMQAGGAVIVYQRNGGSGCVDELYAIYPDGRIVGDDGTQTVAKQASPEDVTALVANHRRAGLVHRRHVLDLAHAPAVSASPTSRT